MRTLSRARSGGDGDVDVQVQAELDVSMADRTTSPSGCSKGVGIKGAAPLRGTPA